MPKTQKASQIVGLQHFIYTLVLAIIMVFSSCKTERVREKQVKDQSELLSSVIVKRSDVDYALILESDSMTRSLTFYKHKDSSVYHHLKYQFSSEKTIKLKDELYFINELWLIADDSIEADLSSIMIGYPLQYEDVLKNQILAFRDSLEWKEGVFQNYQLMRDLMKKKTVYYPLDSLLEKRGLMIQGFSTEKHGYVPNLVLKNSGFDETLKIPVPFMVWINIEQHKN